MSVPYTPPYGGAVILRFFTAPTYTPDSGSAVVLNFNDPEPDAPSAFMPWVYFHGFLPM